MWGEHLPEPCAAREQEMCGPGKGNGGVCFGGFPAGAEHWARWMFPRQQNSAGAVTALVNGHCAEGVGRILSPKFRVAVQKG